MAITPEDLKPQPSPKLRNKARRHKKVKERTGRKHVRKRRAKPGKKDGRAFETPLSAINMDLTQAEYRVVDFYMQGNNKEQSLLKAGYTPMTARKYMWVVFGRERVVREIERRRRLLEARKTNIVDLIQDELAKIAFFNIGKVLRVTDDGSMILDFEDADLDDLAAIGEVTIEEYMEGKGDYAEKVKRVKFKPYDKKAALDSLARIHGLFNDRLTVGDEGSLEERLQAGRNRAKPASKKLNAPDVVDVEFEEVTEEVSRDTSDASGEG